MKCEDKYKSIKVGYANIINNLNYEYDYFCIKNSENPELKAKEAQK